MPNTTPIHYIELPTFDMKASKDFYATAFGWTYKDWGPGYTEIFGAGLEGGFILTETPPNNTSALVILFSEDLDTCERAVKRAGGTITAHHEFPGGRRFHFRDPIGLELAVWTKTSP